MKMPSWYISRRMLLQTAGTSMALPMLEAMVRPGARAAGAVPRRFLAVHGLVYGYVGRYDGNQNTKVAPWTIMKPGASLPLESNTYLQPFFDRKIDSKITVISGLTERILWGTHDSAVKTVAGTFPLARNTGSCTVLVADNGTGTMGPPPQPDPFNGATADQIAARHLGKMTPIPHMYVAATNGTTGSRGFAMSYKSTKEPVPADTSALNAFNRLFAGYDPKETSADVERRARYHKSVLDGLKTQANSLKARLGRSDKLKLTGYLDSISDLERLIASSGSGLPAGSMPPPKYFTSGELAHKAMQGVITQAFITDRTRVIAFSGPPPGNWLKMRAPGQESVPYSKYRTFTGKPLIGDHHGMSHYESGLDGGPPSDEITAMKQEWMDIYAHWSLEMYADLLAELDKHMDIDGQSTILDNTVAVWGGDDSDSSAHACGSMPCVLGGLGGKSDSGAWRIKAGRQLRFSKCDPDDQILYAFLRGSPYGEFPNERGWKDLLWGMLNIVGVPDPSDGKSPLKSFGYAKHPLDQDLA